MEPIAKCLDSMQADSSLYGRFIPMIYSLEISLKKFCTESTKQSNKLLYLLAQELTNHLRTRFEKFFLLDHCMEVNSAILATITTPNFKLRPFENEFHETIKTILINACNEEISKSDITSTSK